MNGATEGQILLQTLKGAEIAPPSDTKKSKSTGDKNLSTDDQGSTPTQKLAENTEKGTPANSAIQGGQPGVADLPPTDAGKKAAVGVVKLGPQTRQEAINSKSDKNMREQRTEAANAPEEKKTHPTQNYINTFKDLTPTLVKKRQQFKGIDKSIFVAQQATTSVSGKPATLSAVAPNLKILERDGKTIFLKMAPKKKGEKGALTVEKELTVEEFKNEYSQFINKKRKLTKTDVAKSAGAGLIIAGSLGLAGLAYGAAKLAKVNTKEDSLQAINWSVNWAGKTYENTNSLLLTFSAFIVGGVLGTVRSPFHKIAKYTVKAGDFLIKK